MKYSYAGYFENEVLRKRDYLKKRWCIDVINNPLKVEEQDNGRVRFWGVVKEVEGKFLRVVTLSDKTTIHNAFFDRGYKL